MAELLKFVLDADELDFTLKADRLNFFLNADELDFTLNFYDEAHPIYRLLLDFMSLSGDYKNE